jgi:transcriptional regulator with XRE-family HTH domain
MARKKSDDEFTELRDEEERLACEIGHLIAKHIKFSGWNRDELLKKLGYTDGKQITKWKSGKNRISAAKLALLADLLECSVSSFFPGAREPTSLGARMEHHLRRGELQKLIRLIAENLPEDSSKE